MQNNNEEIKELFNKIDVLGQKIFFNAAHAGPTNTNPKDTTEWAEYIQARKDLNALLPEGSRTTAVVITTTRLFIKDKGFVTGYYHDLILAPEDFNLRMYQIVGSERLISEIMRFD